jgi:hypothetical protein
MQAECTASCLQRKSSTFSIAPPHAACKAQHAENAAEEEVAAKGT